MSLLVSCFRVVLIPATRAHAFASLFAKLLRVVPLQVNIVRLLLQQKANLRSLQSVFARKGEQAHFKVCAPNCTGFPGDEASGFLQTQSASDPLCPDFLVTAQLSRLLSPKAPGPRRPQPEIRGGGRIDTHRLAKRIIRLQHSFPEDCVFAASAKVARRTFPLFPWESKRFLGSLVCAIPRPSLKLFSPTSSKLHLSSRRREQNAFVSLESSPGRKLHPQTCLTPDRCDSVRP